jgi:hypothetical protein
MILTGQLDAQGYAHTSLYQPSMENLLTLALVRLVSKPEHLCQMIQALLVHFRTPPGHQQP